MSPARLEVRMDSLLPFLWGSCIPYNMPVYPGAQCMVAIYVSHQSREKHKIPGRAQESAHCTSSWSQLLAHRAAPGLLHRRWSGALQSEAEAQVQQTDHCLHVDHRNCQLHPRIRIFLLAVVPLGWWSLHPAGPDIYLLPKTPKSASIRISRLRISWCTSWRG